MSRAGKEPRGPVLPAAEVRDALLGILRRRGMAPCDLDELCVTRYEQSIHPMAPGSAERALNRLAHAETCTLAVADKLFTALGENLLLHLDSYRRLVAEEQGAGATVIDLVAILGGRRDAGRSEAIAA